MDHPDTAPPAKGSSMASGSSAHPHAHPQPSAAAAAASEAQQIQASAREKLQELSQKAQESTQHAAAQVKEGLRHPGRAAPYVLPVLAVLLIVGAVTLPLSYMLGKAGAKSRSATHYDNGDGHGLGSMVRDKWDRARDTLLGQANERATNFYPDERSFGDRILGRRTPSEDLKYHGQHVVDEGEHELSDFWQRAKEKMFGAKESAEESSSEFIVRSIDSLTDRLHELRQYYAGRTREEKPLSWLRHSWDNILEGMHNLRKKVRNL